MRWCASLCLATIFCPALLYGGPIYGSIFFKGAAFKQATISIVCGGRTVASGPTRDDGSYRVLVPQEGRCTLNASNGNIQANADIVSYSSATQYNFEVKERSGGYELRRQ